MAAFGDAAGIGEGVGSMKTSDIPTREQWKGLYQAAIFFKEAEPWRDLFDSDLICLENPWDKTIGYCSVMGKIGRHFALGVFLGEAGLVGFVDLMGRGDLPASQVMYYQNHLMCSFENREFLDKKERRQIRELGFSFRGKNAWPQFRRYEEGYFPWYLNRAECQFLTLALKQTCAVVSEYRRQKIRLDLDRGRTVLRYSSLKNGELVWKSREFQLHWPSVSYTPLPYRDDLFIQRLKKANKRIPVILQAEICYLPLTVQEGKDEKPYFPRAFFLADADSGRIIDHHMYQHSQHDGEVVLRRLADFFLENGVPAEIQVRSGKMPAVLGEFSAQTEINLRIVTELPGIEQFVQGITERLE